MCLRSVELISNRVLGPELNSYVFYEINRWGKWLFPSFMFIVYRDILGLNLGSDTRCSKWRTCCVQNWRITHSVFLIQIIHTQKRKEHTDCCCKKKQQCTLYCSIFTFGPTLFGSIQQLSANNSVRHKDYKNIALQLVYSKYEMVTVYTKNMLIKLPNW
jgi:hypothetical protein